MTDKPLLIITRGLPASGKTTWAKTWVAEDIDNRTRVNRDDLRALLHGTATYQHPQEAAVTEAAHAAVSALLRSGRSVVVDDTNLRAKYVRAYMELARKAGANYEVRDFPVSLERAFYWDEKRGGRAVGADVIQGMFDRYLKQHGGNLPPVPELDAEFTGQPYDQDWTLPPAILVDIDGTVALHNGRSPYDYSKVSDDIPNDNVIQLVRALRRDGFQVVFLSGRPESCHKDTFNWLGWEVGGHFHGPFMRAEGDQRDDSIVKLELFDKHVRPHFNVVGVLDDRNRVVRAWRSIGLTVLQVADGDF